jgi:hypothetical protein
MGGINDLSGGDCMYRFGCVMLTEIIPQLITHSKTNFQEYMLICVFSQASARAPNSNAALASPTSPDERGGSKANNRFSTAFGRFGSGSATERSLSQSAGSTLQSPMEGPQVVESSTVEQPSALPVTGADAHIAPWTEEKPDALDKDLINERFKRIGLLPSPAFGGSMNSHESNENIKGKDENDDPMSRLQGATRVDELSKNHEDEIPMAVAMDALPEAVAPSHVDGVVSEPQAAVSAPPSASNDTALSSDTTREIASDPSRPVEHTSNINRSPTRRPVPQQNTSDVQPTSRRSSISSLNPEDKDLTETSIPLQRSVSPLRDESTTRLPVTVEKVDTEHTEEDEDRARPRVVSRSSLPSQQRPQSQTRQSSWQWKSSGTSLAGLNKAQGDATASPIKARSLSGQHLNSGPVSRAESPVSFLEMGPSQKRSTTSTPGAYSSEDVSAVPGARQEQPIMASPQNLTLVPAPYEVGRMAPIVQSPVEMQGPWQNDQFNAPIAPRPFAGPAAMYSQPSAMSSEQIIHEEPATRTFSPTVMDPRQHGSEYQLPGVGPPEINQGSRRSRFSIRSPGPAPVQNERINPNAMMFDHQRTFSGDEVPLTQSAQEKREKRRSGIFSALSRGSSFSGLSGMNSDGRQSRGNDVSQASSQHQVSTQPSSTAQKAREISGGSARGNTLKKVQRSSTSAGTSSTPDTLDPEKKNKRFSRLGSIFGRSNSDVKKTNKLVKGMPKNLPERVLEATVAGRARSSAPQNVPPPPPMGVSYGMENGMQPPQQWPEHPEQQGMAPPGGWYAPTSRRSSYHQDQQASLPQIQPTMSRRSSHQQDQQANLPPMQPTVSGQSWQSSMQPPQQQQSPVMQPTRRLHSEGYRHEPRYNAPSDYRSMSPSPLRGQRGSQQYDTTTPQNYQRTPSWSGGPRQQQPPAPGRNFSWGSVEQQQQQGYFPQPAMSGSPVRQSPAGSPSHSRDASFGSMTNIQAAAPPLYRNSSSGALQRSSSPSMYGATQPYQVPIPAPTEAQLMSKTQQDWYPRYTVGSPGPPQQASTPGMYTRGYSNSRPGSSNANTGGFDDIPEGEYARPTSAGGMMMPPVQHQQGSSQSPVRGQQRRYYGGGGGGAMGPRPYPGANGQQQGEFQGTYRDV